jgi:hypothetical protein
MSLLLGCGLPSVFQSLAKPTETPIPTPTPIPGWQKFEGKGIAVWLPDSFEGGNLDQDVDVIVSKLKALGPDFDQLATTIDQNRSMFAFWAFDTNLGSTKVLTNVNVTKEQVLSAITVDTYLDSAISLFPAQFSVMDRKNVTLAGRPAGRLLVEYSAPGQKVEELFYTIKDGNTMWNITYATGEDEFDQRLPMFEQSVQTLTTE